MFAMVVCALNFWRALVRYPAFFRRRRVTAKSVPQLLLQHYRPQRGELANIIFCAYELAPISVKSHKAKMHLCLAI